MHIYIFILIFIESENLENLLQLKPIKYLFKIFH